MAPQSDPAAGEPLRLSDLIGLIPRLPELGPLVDRLASSSLADPERRWTGSGELGALGARIVDPAAVSRAASSVAAEEAGRLARLYERIADVVRALADGDRDRALARLIEQGQDDERLGRDGEAREFYSAAERIARDDGHSRAAEAMRLAARAARNAGDLADAETRYEEAWRVAQRTDTGADATTAAIGRGNVAVDRGRWNEAREWYERALARIRDGGPPARERWQVLQNLAIVGRRSGRIAEARRLLTEAEEEARLLEDPDAPVEIGNGWGQLLLAEGDFRGAELHFARALGLAGSPRARATIAVNLGEALLRQGRALEAGERAREAEAVALTRGITSRLPEVYRLLAAVAKARGENDAFVLLEQALSLIRERNLPPYEEAVTREAYGELRLAEGDRERGVTELRMAARIFGDLGADDAVERLGRRIAETESNERGGA